MRVLVIGLALAAAACGDTAEQAVEADAAAANFVPPAVISRVDYGTRQDRRFTRLDKDGDGILAAAELPDNPRLRTLDRNNDGEITSSEFNEGQMNRFDAMDLNKDGTLTSDERVEARGE
jgi:basic membrane lipoprotein Med (substrate-binding protein (PBP1-ABC) superfamily)